MSRWKYGAYLVLFLCASCNRTDNQTNKVAQTPVQKTKPIISEQNTPKTLNRLSEQKLSKSAMLEIDRMDAGIEVIQMTEELAKTLEITNFDQCDPGFTKWLFSFNVIPGNPPYSLEQKRVFQPVFDCFYPIQNGVSSEEIHYSKSNNKPVRLLLSARGFLPGEQVTIRLSAKDASKEISFYPRPLHLKDAAGKVLAKAVLFCAQPDFTGYNLDISGVEKEQKYTFTSQSGGEILSHAMQGPMQCSITPDVIGKTGGIAKAILQFEDEISYSLELPWGRELLEYKAGKK